MNYMLLIYAAPPPTEPTPAQFQAMMEAYGVYTEQLRAAGAFVDGAPLAPATSATTVRLRDGQRLVTDGPFAETKEYLGGYYLLDCPNLDRALELAAACPGAAYGSIEIRPVVDP
jgi:hypothetical protein